MSDSNFDSNTSYMSDSNISYKMSYTYIEQEKNYLITVTLIDNDFKDIDQKYEILIYTGRSYTDVNNSDIQQYRAVVAYYYFDDIKLRYNPQWLTSLVIPVPITYIDNNDATNFCTYVAQYVKEYFGQAYSEAFKFLIHFNDLALLDLSNFKIGRCVTNTKLKKEYHNIVDEAEQKNSDIVLSTIKEDTTLEEMLKHKIYDFTIGYEIGREKGKKNIQNEFRRLLDMMD